MFSPGDFVVPILLLRGDLPTRLEAIHPTGRVLGRVPAKNLLLKNERTALSSISLVSGGSKTFAPHCVQSVSRYV